MPKKEMTERILEVMKHPERIRNIATSSHVHHGKTSLTDNLAALAGMISEKVAADVETGMLTWIDERSY
jgi:elongation factor 2